ncbi:MAG: ATP-dependent Clp protease ATP-binding subunit [Clostridia bacterium]|nr:ATP-dependent Clp protease ATP-binding subunit [Clostridia bacterium]
MTLVKTTLSAQSQLLIRQAGRQAAAMGHSFIGTEHLLLAMLQLQWQPAGRVLRQLGWEETDVRGLVLERRGRGAPGKDPIQGISGAVRRVIGSAANEAARLHQSLIEPEHLLLALARERKCTAAAILQQAGANLDVIFSDAYDCLQSRNESQQIRRETDTRLLEQFCENMLEKAAGMDPVIGREREIDALMQVLSRKNKNNPALIGEPGVGKTAIVEGFAMRLTSGQVPEQLNGKKLFCLNMASVLAGTKYRGEFEERIRDILAEIHRCGNVILFVDEMHTLVGAGSAEGAIDAANLLKPALGRGELQMIGATTLEEYRKYIEKDAALERRFRPITVREPTQEQTIRILQGLRPGLEQHHRIRISDEAIHAAVTLSCRYLTERFLPDKALDLLDESAARSGFAETGGPYGEEKRQLSEELEKAVRESRYEYAAQLRDSLTELLKRQMRASQSRRAVCVTARDVEMTVSDRTQIPVGKLCQSEKQRLQALPAALSARVIGQEQAVRDVCEAVFRASVGFMNGKRPRASMLFMGPSGVGKTELCKALADCVYGSSEALVRIDMTEYMEPASVTRRSGAPPGYVGHEEGGTRTEKVRRRPFCVVLRDELEKAHRDVTGLLLQILEDGVLTDCVGRKVDFRNTMIVMTSNLGSGRTGKPGLGFSPIDETGYNAALLRESFSVEFLGRIDCITGFRRLSEDSLARIAEMQLLQLAGQMQKQEITLRISPKAAETLAALCAGEDTGARGLRHRIQSLIEAPAARILLADPSCREVSVRVEDGRITVTT